MRYGKTLLTFLALFSLNLPFVFPAEETFIRVAILQEVESARITVAGPCRARDLKTGALLAEWPQVKWKEVKAASSGIRFGGETLASQRVLLESLKDGLFRVNAKPYRGTLLLQQTSNGRLMVVNRLPLEEYLVGALTSEADSKWPIEALKAHAVVSRTLVAHRIWIRKGQPFDVTADTSTHLYYGVSAERGKTREAAETTRGQVLAYKGELFSASFHANCGGHTEDAKEIWQTRGDLLPLTGVPDPYCNGLRHFEWETVVEREQFGKLLGAIAEEVGTVENIEVTERNHSGRVKGVKILGQKGTTSLTGRKFRELLGENRLRSLNFTVSVTPHRVTFHGFGWGHGVGLCQWGAYGMSRKGKKVEEILSFYFPGAARRSLKGLPGFTS